MTEKWLRSFVEISHGGLETNLNDDRKPTTILFHIADEYRLSDKEVRCIASFQGTSECYSNCSDSRDLVGANENTSG